MLNVHHCLIVVSQMYYKYWDDTVLFLFYYPNFILVFSAHSEHALRDEAISWKNHEGQCGFTGQYIVDIDLIYMVFFDINLDLVYIGK